jgi:hypothetical protein
MTTFRTVRTKFDHNKDAGIYFPHHGHVTGPYVTVNINAIDPETGDLQIYQFKVILRLDGGQWVNVTLARSGQSIAQLRNVDYSNAGSYVGSKSRPRATAQALIRRLAFDHGNYKLARTLLHAEQAGPIHNPDVPSLSADLL